MNSVYTLILVMMVLLSFIIPVTSALNITARTGETYIVYQWEPNYTVNVYIDGVRQVTNSAFHDYYLTDINPDEKHQLKLYNSSNSSQLMGSLTVTTLHSQTIILILIVIQFIFIILLILIKDPIKIILLGTVSIAICLYTLSASLGYGALSIIPIVSLVITGIFIALALWNIIIEKTQW